MRIGQKGFTLVEIIVSLAIMTIVAGSVGAFIVAGNNSYLRGNKELTLQEEAQLTANQMIDLIIDVEKDILFLDSTGCIGWYSGAGCLRQCYQQYECQRASSV